MKHSLGVAGTVALISGLALAAGQSASADTIVKIGSAAPLTGGIAHIGQDQNNGVILAVEDINKKGLMIGGQKVTLQVDSQDDQADPRQGTQVAQKLADDGDVAVVGHLNSGVSIPASKIYNANSMVMVTPASTNPTLTLQGFNNVYRTIGTDAQQGPALARWAKEGFKAKTVAIVDDATAYGQGLANEFEKTAKAEGIKVLSHDETTDTATDFRAILTKIKAERPDVIMYGGMDATGGPFAKQAQQLAIRAKILSGDGVCTTTLQQLAGPAVDNVTCSVAGIALEKMPGGAAFSKEYEKRFGQPIVIYSPFSYDAVGAIVAAMKKANSTDRKAVVAAMPSVEYKGVTGTIGFDQHGDLKGASISLYKYVKGKQELLTVMKM